jgi:hypothetical protein
MPRTIKTRAHAVLSYFSNYWPTALHGLPSARAICSASGWRGSSIHGIPQCGWPCWCRGAFEDACGRWFYRPIVGPAKPTRLMVGLHYLKHVHDLSGEELVGRWMENRKHPARSWAPYDRTVSSTPG